MVVPPKLSPRSTVEVVDTIERVRVTIRWTGGYESHHEIARSVGKFDQLARKFCVPSRRFSKTADGNIHSIFIIANS